jgi:hypothetical protein
VENLLGLNGSMTKSVTLGIAVPPRWGGEFTLSLTEPSVHSLHLDAAAIAVGPVTTVARTARATVLVTATKALFNPSIVISLGYPGPSDYWSRAARGGFMSGE